MAKRDKRIKGKTFEERYVFQMEQWAEGVSMHADQCCPDFSCCNKLMYTPIDVRKKFVAAYKEKGEAGIVPFLMEFLGQAMLITTGKSLNVKVIGGESNEEGTCSYCNTKMPLNDLRPYGKNGSEICQPCAIKPENVQIVLNTFSGQQLDKISSKN